MISRCLFPSSVLKQKAGPEYEHRGCATKAKLARQTLSNLNEAGYGELQTSSAERILDNRPNRDQGIPPLELLYHGFGRFYDDLKEAKRNAGILDTDIDLKRHVDNLAGRTCELGSEIEQRAVPLQSLKSALGIGNEVFFIALAPAIPVLGSVTTSLPLLVARGSSSIMDGLHIWLSTKWHQTLSNLPRTQTLQTVYSLADEFQPLASSLEVRVKVLAYGDSS